MKICGFCFQRVSSFSIYKIKLITSKTTYEIGMLTLLEHIDDWLYKKMYHLSASQLLLLRPDLVGEFFKEYKPTEEIRSWSFIEYRVCSECFESYKPCVPIV